MKIERKKFEHIIYSLNEIKFGDCFILLENKEEILLKLKNSDVLNCDCLCYNFNKKILISLPLEYNCYKIETVKLIYEF